MKAFVSAEIINSPDPKALLFIGTFLNIWLPIPAASR